MYLERTTVVKSGRKTFAGICKGGTKWIEAKREVKHNSITQSSDWDWSCQLIWIEREKERAEKMTTQTSEWTAGQHTQDINHSKPLSQTDFLRQLTCFIVHSSSYINNKRQYNYCHLDPRTFDLDQLQKQKQQKKTLVTRTHTRTHTAHCYVCHAMVYLTCVALPPVKQKASLIWSHLMPCMYIILDVIRLRLCSCQLFSLPTPYI